MESKRKDNHTELAKLLAQIAEPTSEEAGQIDGLTVVDHEGRTILLSADQVRQILKIVSKRLVTFHDKRKAITRTKYIVKLKNPDEGS